MSGVFQAKQMLIKWIVVLPYKITIYIIIFTQEMSDRITTNIQTFACFTPVPSEKVKPENQQA